MSALIFLLSLLFLCQVWALFKDQRGDDDTLTSEGFVTSGVKLLRVHPDPAYVSSVLDLVFCILDRDQRGVVSFTEAVAGLCMISDAPLEEKLAFAFALCRFCGSLGSCCCCCSFFFFLFFCW